MIDHVSIGVRDIVRAKHFYDSVLMPLGYACLSTGDSSLGYGKDAVQLWIIVSGSSVPTDPKSGLHFCFDAPDRESVTAFHRAGLATGGRDNGKPGLREDYGPNYFASFIIDPDGYRIEAYSDSES